MITLKPDIKEIASQYVVREIAYDRYNATQIILNLQDEGLTMVPFGQGFKDMSPPTKELYSLVLKEKSYTIIIPYFVGTLIMCVLK